MNPRPSGYEPDELPAAPPRVSKEYFITYQTLFQALKFVNILVEGAGFEPAKATAGRFTVCSLWPLGNPSVFNQWSRRWDSNPQPADYKSAALPIELRRHDTNFIIRLGHVLVNSVHPHIFWQLKVWTPNTGIQTFQLPQRPAQDLFFKLHSGLFPIPVPGCS